MSYRYVPIPNPNDQTRADGAAYKEMRKKRGETVERLARRFGVSPADVENLERGQGLLLQEGQELRQLPDGSVRYG